MEWMEPVPVIVIRHRIQKPKTKIRRPKSAAADGRLFADSSVAITPLSLLLFTYVLISYFEPPRNYRTRPIEILGGERGKHSTRYTDTDTNK